MEYRFHWQTVVGISMLAVMLLLTMFLPDGQVQKNNGNSVIRISIASWALTVDEDNVDTTRMQIQEGKKINNDRVISALRLWGWLLLVPIILIVINIIFMIARRRTLSGFITICMAVTIICESIIRLYVPSKLLWKESYHSASSVAVLIMASLIVLYGILCMTVFNNYNADARFGPYDNIYVSVSDIEEHKRSLSTPGVRTVGILKGIKGEYAGQTLEVHAGEEIILGRDPQYCMLIFSNPRVSRRQCGIRYDVNNGYYQAIDYSSAGTTLSDGTLLTTSEYTPLPPGTVIYMAKGQEAIQLV